MQQFEDGINWTFDPYIPNDSAAKFLTNAPNIEYVDSDQYRTISWLGVATSQAGTIRVKFYEADGTVIQSEDIDISLEGGSDPNVSEDDAMQFFGCGPQNFEDGDVANLKPSNNLFVSRRKKIFFGSIYYYYYYYFIFFSSFFLVKFTLLQQQNNITIQSK